MKTEVILKRSFMGGEIRQKSKCAFFNATDLVKIANSKRRDLGKSLFNLAQYLKLKSTCEFIEELHKDNEKVITKSRGRNSTTWVHPLLFIDIALSLDSRFKVEVYKWLYDELLKNRNNSGESYKKMVGAVYDKYTNKQDFHKYIAKVANYIKKECSVNNWDEADEKKLFLRDKMHENIALLTSVLTDTNQAVRLGVLKAKEEYGEVELI